MQLLFENQLNKRQRWIRGLLLAFLLMALIGGALLYRPAVRHYQNWKQDRALAQAQAFTDRADYVQAKLALEVALAAVPGDQDTLRAAADLLDSVGAAEVLPLRRHLVALNPASTDDRLALIRSALTLDDTNTVADALRDMPTSESGNPEALRAALAYAESTGNKPVADALYSRLRDLEPDNQNLEVMQAVLRLGSPTPGIAESAHETLRALADQPRHALFIQRQLLLDALRRNDTAAAEAIAAHLASLPGANLADRLHGANLALNHLRRPFPAVRDQILPHVGENAEDAATWVRWLLIVGQIDEALAWLDAHPRWKDDPALAGSRAELAAAAADWDELARLLAAGAWGTIDGDTLQLAFSAHVARRRDNATLQNELWLEALASAGSSLSKLTVLYRLSTVWKWDPIAERMLWAIVRAHPEQGWATQTLFNVYHLRKSTADLLALFTLQRQSPGASPRQRHDWAILTLLVEQRLSWTPEKQELQNLHEAQPDNPHFAIGYALALAMTRQPEKARQVLGSLSAADLARPDRAPYLAYIYSVAGDHEAVSAQTAKRDQLTHLLPEEINLFDQARLILNERRGRPIAPKANG